MSELEDKLGSVLANPQLMQQIMSMAQSLGSSQAPEEPKQPSAPSLPDPQLMQSLAGIARQGSVTSNQQALLSALTPYLSRDRVSRLERAMRAAGMAGAASAFLSAGGLNLLSGR